MQEQGALVIVKEAGGVIRPPAEGRAGVNDVIEILVKTRVMSMINVVKGLLLIEMYLRLWIKMVMVIYQDKKWKKH